MSDCLNTFQNYLQGRSLPDTRDPIKIAEFIQEVGKANGVKTPTRTGLIILAKTCLNRSGGYSESRPGSELKKMLSWFHTTGSCGCDDMAKKMDSWGPEGCQRNIDGIVDHLENAAKERLRIPIHRSVLKCLVHTAIRRSQKLAKA